MQKIQRPEILPVDQKVITNCIHKMLLIKSNYSLTSFQHNPASYLADEGTLFCVNL